MSKQQVKLNNWPFKQGEQTQLIWISSPFRYEKKMMIHAYFKSKGRTERLLLDWGTLPALMIQHYYIDGSLQYIKPPENIEEVEITIYPDAVRYSERNWTVQGTGDIDKSRSFSITYNNKNYVLPLIEVVRSILAPNRFLLSRLFESNSFEQYFLVSCINNDIDIAFTSNYEFKYTRSQFLYQLVWLLTTPSVRKTFENVALDFLQTQELVFDWPLEKPITIIALVTPTPYGGIIRKINCVKNKQINVDISFSHPNLKESEKSGEAKKYTLKPEQSSKNSTEKTLIEDVDGTTDSFDLIELSQQVHEYHRKPKITKVRQKSNKIRSYEDDTTKKITFQDTGIRSMADTGGNQVVRGIENLVSQEIQEQGELREFVRILRELENYQQVQSVDLHIANLPIVDGKRKFTYLDDGVTNRQYAVATINLFNDKQYRVVEVERESRSLSMLILSSDLAMDWDNVLEELLLNLVNDSGTWLKSSLEHIEKKDIIVKKAKHSKKNFEHRAKLLCEKLI